MTTPSYANDVQAIWDAKCVSCHDGTQANIPMNLTAGASHAALVNQAMVKNCTDGTRVVPGDRRARV